MDMNSAHGFSEARSDFDFSGSSIRNLDEALSAIDRDPAFDPEFDAKRFDGSIAAIDPSERYWS